MSESATQYYYPQPALCSECWAYAAGGCLLGVAPHRDICTLTKRSESVPSPKNCGHCEKLGLVSVYKEAPRWLCSLGAGPGGPGCLGAAGSLSRWDRRFLDLAKHIAAWSKDPSTQCGAVIADQRNRVVSVGYNGFPRGVDDSDARLQDRETRLKLTLHAERNALAFAERSVEGCTIYVSPMPPCSQCAAAIVQAGIMRVVAMRADSEREKRWGDDLALAREIYREAGAKLIEVDEQDRSNALDGRSE